VQAMTSPLLRLFAVVWWLLVAAALTVNPIYRALHPRI
jgi:hypothetical protein